MVDLVLQELGSLVEQIDRDQPVGEPADHLVAAPADRRQLAEFIEHAERIDRRQVVALGAQEDLREQRRGSVLRLRARLSELGSSRVAVRAACSDSE